MLHQALCIISKSSVKIKLKLQSGNAQFGCKSAICCPVWPWYLTDDLENNRAPLLCVSFHSRRWSLSYSPETPNLGQNGDVFSLLILKLDRWPWKTIGHLFYGTSSLMHHYVYVSTGELKLELQSGNAQFGSISTIFQPYDLGILQMNLQNIRAPLLCHFKCCASFRSNCSIQTWVTVRKCPILVKIDDFFSRVTLKFDGWPWKQ